MPRDPQPRLDRPTRTAFAFATRCAVGGFVVGVPATAVALWVGLLVLPRTSGLMLALGGPTVAIGGGGLGCLAGAWAICSARDRNGPRAATGLAILGASAALAGLPALLWVYGAVTNAQGAPSGPPATMPSGAVYFRAPPTPAPDRDLIIGTSVLLCLPWVLAALAGVAALLHGRALRGHPPPEPGPPLSWRRRLVRGALLATPVLALTGWWWACERYGPPESWGPTDAVRALDEGGRRGRHGVEAVRRLGAQALPALLARIEGHPPRGPGLAADWADLLARAGRVVPAFTEGGIPCASVPNPNTVLLQAVRALEGDGAPAAAVLLAWARREPSISDDVQRTIGDMGPDAWPVLLRALEREELDAVRVAKTFRRGTWLAEPAAAAVALVAPLTDPERPRRVRVDATVVLAALGPAAIPTLFRLTTVMDRPVADAASEALAQASGLDRRSLQKWDAHDGAAALLRAFERSGEPPAARELRLLVSLAAVDRGAAEAIAEAWARPGARWPAALPHVVVDRPTLLGLLALWRVAPASLRAAPLGPRIRDAAPGPGGPAAIREDVRDWDVGERVALSETCAWPPEVLWWGTALEPEAVAEEAGEGG